MTEPKRRFRDLVVAESVRLEEDRLGRILDDPEAEARARALDGDFEQRILARAAAMDLGRRMDSAIDQVEGIRHGFLLAVVLLAALVGAGAALAAFGRDPAVNVLVALSALLGLQLLMLLLWFLFALYPFRSGGGVLGRVVMESARRLGRRLSRRADTAVVVSAVAGLMRREGLGRWTASALTHGLWAAFCAAALLVSLILLSVRQYDFVWGTTILSEQQFVALIAVLSAPAQWVGWAVPDPETIRASRMGGPGPAGRELWSAFLLSGLLFFGLLPRTLLAVFSAAMLLRAARRLRLETGLPGYARLAGRLSSPSRALGVVDPAPALPIEREEGGMARPAPVSGPALVIGAELERDQDDWPPRLSGIGWIVLGRADDRLQRRDILAALGAWGEPPAVVLVVCSLARTPDRGTERFLAQVRERSAAPVWAVLDEGNRLQERGGDRVERLLHWRRCAKRAGLAYVLEAELDDPRHRGSRELLQLLGHGAEHSE